MDRDLVVAVGVITAALLEVVTERVVRRKLAGYHDGLEPATQFEFNTAVWLRDVGGPRR